MSDSLKKIEAVGKLIRSMNFKVFYSKDLLKPCLIYARRN